MITYGLEHVEAGSLLTVKNSITSAIAHDILYYPLRGKLEVGCKKSFKNVVDEQVGWRKTLAMHFLAIAVLARNCSHATRKQRICAQE